MFTKGPSEGNNNTRNGIYADSSLLELHASTIENDLTSFKKYLDNKNSQIHKYIGENGIVYSYNLSLDVYAYNPDNQLINTSVDVGNQSSSPSSPWKNIEDNMSSFLGTTTKGAKNFQELMPGTNNQVVSSVITYSYDLLYGKWSNKYNEVVLVLDKNNSIPTAVLYQLGIISKDKYEDMQDKINKQEKIESFNWSYEELSKNTFYLLPSCDYYIKNEDNTFKYIADDDDIHINQLINNALKLKITGVIRPKEDAVNDSIISSVAYTSLLTNYLIDYTNKSEVIVSQENTPTINVLNNIANISPVFNAETLIIGLCSGIIGVIASHLLTIPINNIIHSLAETDEVNAYLSIGAVGILIIISVVITVIGGLLPAYKAAKKDPVIALRSE